MANSPFITAHAGCENTLVDSFESIGAGINAGADIIELDVRRGNDGLLILSHNPPKLGIRKVKLSRALKTIAASQSIVNCDIKDPSVIDETLVMAYKSGLSQSQILLTGSVVPEFLLQNPSLTTKAGVWLNIEQLLGWYIRTNHPIIAPFSPKSNSDFHSICLSLIPKLESNLFQVAEDCQALGVNVLNLPYHFEQAGRLIGKIIETGIGVSLWTVDQPKDLEQFLALGVTNITTNQVKLACGIRASLTAKQIANKKEEDLA